MDANGYSGYDPHDIKGAPIFLYFLKPGHNLLIKAVRRPFFYFIDYFPRLSRKIFGIKKTTNAKGIALFAKGFLNLFKITGDPKYHGKAIECLDWLMANTSKGFENNCWGYPFDWQSGVYTPAGTPASVVTAAVGDAFWTAWKTLGDQKYLDTCSSICKFFLEDLNIDPINDDTICFSYTPLDKFHVHNANLLVAEYLIRVGSETDRKDWIATGLKASNFALIEQNEDGSLFYWAADQNFYSPNTIDQYHSGFEIRCLHGIWRHTGDSRYRKAVDDYYAFYLKNLVVQLGENDFMPKMTPRSLYPINIHSCAEAILLNSLMANENDAPRGFLDTMLPSILSRMQNADGSFAYIIRKTGNFLFTDRTPYIRWGQGWMLLALSEYLSYKNRPGK